MKFTYQDENDTNPSETLDSYTVKCELHNQLSDQAAYEAALDHARTINIGEGYVLE